VPSVGVVQGLFVSKNVLKGIMEKGKGGIKLVRGYDNVSSKPEEKDIEPIRYTDLIFVIHGIGQKLSERGSSPDILRLLKCKLNRLPSPTPSTSSEPFSTRNEKMRPSKTMSARTFIPVFSP
jgi:hypothetical protein